MKYNLNLNQAKLIDWGLNLQQGCLVDLFTLLPSWSECEIIEGEAWYFFSKNKILEQIPLLSQKWNIDTIYRQTKILIEKDLLRFKKIWQKDYWQLTPKIKEWNFKNSEKFPNELGKISELNSEKNPTYNNISNNDKINDKKICPFFSEFWQVYKRKIDKEKAEKKFERLSTQEKMLAVAGAKNWAAKWDAEETDLEFIPHPTTWLNNRRWEAEIFIKTKTKKVANAYQTEPEDFLAWFTN